MTEYAPEIETVRETFLARTGLSSVEVSEEIAGPETFLRFRVCKDAPLYRRVLAQIDEGLPDEHPFHGRLSLDVQKTADTLNSPEVELLRSLITQSLRVTTELAESGAIVEFMPFRGGQHNRVVQPANHAILGRRGVGKSSLILMAFKKVRGRGDFPVWIDLEPYAGRSDGQAGADISLEVLRDLKASAESRPEAPDTKDLDSAINLIEKNRPSPSEELVPDRLRRCAPEIRRNVRSFTREAGGQVFAFLDDAHLLGSAIQPHLFAFMNSLFSGAGAWLQVAGVKNLTRLYESASRVGLQAPNDIQVLSLDLTLDDPAAAREHLTGVLNSFLKECGFSRPGLVVRDAAIERLVWCAAGVPRDFLALFEQSIGVAIQQRRRRVGVQDVNVVVGEFGQEKIADLEQDTSEEGDSLRKALERLQDAALNENRSNSFLVRLDTSHDGYQLLQKLVDLRLVHLIHPSVTPGKAGQRFEAYLLDYSFYTGVRRRQNLSELKIRADEPPRYAVLRKLPKIELSRIAGDEGAE